MPTAILGQNYTFHALFLDSANNPLTLLGPTAKVFRFNSVGAEVAVSSGSMSAVMGDPGRYEYTFAVPITLSAGDTLYAVMSGTDSLSMDLVVAQDNADLIYNPQMAGGINARFIR